MNYVQLKIDRLQALINDAEERGFTNLSEQYQQLSLLKLELEESERKSNDATIYPDYER